MWSGPEEWNDELCRSSRCLVTREPKPRAMSKTKTEAGAGDELMQKVESVDAKGRDRHETEH